MAFPNQMARKFPTCNTYSPMGATGQHAPGIISVDGQSVTIRCQGQGVVVAGTTGCTQGSRNSAWSDRWDIRTQNDADLRCNFEGANDVGVMCAKFGQTWRYATHGPGQPAGDPLDCSGVNAPVSSVDVAVIGGGFGGWSHAAALHEHADSGTTSALFYDPEYASTSERSSGVAWFPDRDQHNVSTLKAVTGSNGILDSHLSQYVDSAEESLVFWDNLIGGWRPFLTAEDPVYDYLPAASVANRSYLPADCLGVECGGHLVAKLRAAAPDTEAVGERIVGISSRPSGDFVLQRSSGERTLARVVVVATGGTGHHADQESFTLIHAGDDNTGFQWDLADSLGLTRRGASHFYHLEFMLANGVWSERWFAADACVPAGVSEYNLCKEYSSRSQSYSNEREAVEGYDQKECETPSDVWWSAFFEQYIQNVTHCPPGSRLSPGILDAKGGFDIDAGYRSTQNVRVYASGTAAASPSSANAYFAPGHTIGFALHTGRVTAERVAEQVREIKAAEGDGDRMEWRDNCVPMLFLIGVWLIFVGILWMFVLKRLAAQKIDFPAWLWYGHYILMTVATIVVVIGVWTAVSLSSRPMRDQSSRHSLVGRITVILLVIQTLFGSALQLDTKFVWTRARMAHRALALCIVVLVSYLYITAVYPWEAAPITRHERWISNKESMRAGAIAWSVVAVGLVTLSIVLLLRSQSATDLSWSPIVFHSYL